MQPNIVFIMADQLAASFLNCYGSGVNSSPCLDSLAESGIRFDRCYCTSTVCGPNRASILTGRSASFHGVVVNNLEVSGDLPTWPELLQKAGYRTGGFGKFHHTAMQLPLPADFSHFGYDESVPTEDPKDGAYLEWIKNEHPEWYETALAMIWPRPYHSEEFKKQARAAYDKILKTRRDASEWQTMYPSPLPKELHQTAYITDLSIDFIRRHKKNHAASPFMCHLSYVDPHDPYDPPEPYCNMFNPADMPEPIASVWDKKGNSVLEKGRHFNGFDKISHDIKAIKKMRALYHGSIKFIDDEIKRITDFLKAENLFSNTIYVFTTDHGDMMGDHALITKGVKFFDKGIRIPLIISGAGISGGKECSSLSCSLDLFPTFCAWAGAKSLPPLEGKSLAPICLGKTQDTPWKEVTIEAPCYPAELVKAGAENGVRGIVTADNWRFTIFDEDNTGEMFNLSKDPCEQNNLFYNPDYTEKKLFLFERLTRAFMQAASVQQYRNLPAANGKKFIIGPGIQNFNGEVYQR